MNEIHQLLANGYFWGFLGTLATAILGYKSVLAPIIEERRRRQYLASNGNGSASKISIKKVTSFDELKAVVEILQGELERKDKAHIKELARAYIRIEALETENSRLYDDLEQVKDRLHRAKINHE